MGSGPKIRDKHYGSATLVPTGMTHTQKIYPAMKLAHYGTFVIAWDLVHGFLASSCPKTKTQITPHTPILI